MNEHRCRSTNHTDLELLRALVEGQTLKPHVRTAAVSSVQHTQTSPPAPSQTGLDCAQHTNGSKALPRTLLQALVEGQTVKPHVRTAVQHTQTSIRGAWGCTDPRKLGAVQTLANWARLCTAHEWK